MEAKEYLMSLPDRTKDVDIDSEIDASIMFDLEGDSGGIYTVSIKEGSVHVEPGEVSDPNCQVMGKAENFEKVINKEISPIMALFTGKLKVKGQKELMKYAKLIGLA